MRYGYAIRLGGDPEISGALEAGIRAAAREDTGINATCSEAVRRVAMMRHTPQEWAEMTEEARVIYGGTRCSPAWARAMLAGYALICYGLSLAWGRLLAMMGM